MTNENLPSSIYIVAWNELYKVFSEQLRQDDMDLMDSVLRTVGLDIRRYKN